MTLSSSSIYAPEKDDAVIFTQTNTAIWVLTAASGAFLVVRLWCRYRFSSIWWDDALLTASWVVLVAAAVCISLCIKSGYITDEEKIRFFLFQNVGTALTTISIAWSKVSFAITLLRIVRNRYLIYFLWFVIVSANLCLIPGQLSIWVPACADPRKVFRPAYPYCIDHHYLEYLGGSTIVYGGVIDVLLALFPWFIIRKLLLDTKEKIGLTLAMSMGAITGTVVIFRAFFQLKRTDNNYHFMVFMSIFNFLEPALSIICQAIPMFRVLVINVKRATSAVRITSPTRASGKSNMHSQQMRAWNSRVLGGGSDARTGTYDEELLTVRVDRTVDVSSSTMGSQGSAGSEVMLEDKLYDGTLRQQQSLTICNHV